MEGDILGANMFVILYISVTFYNCYSLCYILCFIIVRLHYHLFNIDQYSNIITLIYHNRAITFEKATSPCVFLLYGSAICSTY